MPKLSELLSAGRPWLRGMLGLGIGALFFWLSLRQTSWREVQEILAQTKGIWLLGAIALYGLDLLVRVVRWRQIMSSVKQLSLRSVGLALIVGYAMNSILPARLGELFRANFAGQRYQMSRTAIAGSIVLERVLDGLVVVLCLLLGRFFAPGQPVLNQLTIAGSLLFGVLFLGLWLLSRGRGEGFRFQLPPPVVQRLEQFRRGIGSLRGPLFRQAVLLSAVIWLLEGAVLWAVLQAVDVALNWQQMLLLVGVVSLSTLLPSAPGFVGTYQYAYVLTLELFDYPPAQGIAAATATQIFLMGSVTLVGLGLYLGTRWWRLGAVQG